MAKKFKLAIFSSGSGTNAEKIIKHFAQRPDIEVALLLSNNPDAYALERAKNLGIATRIFSRDQFTRSNEVIEWLQESGVTHVVLAGFLWLIPMNLIQAFPDKIINIHPSLLPKFGGKGMYGMKVHEAVRAANELKTGITIHLVNEHYDDGKILAQEWVDVDAEDIAKDIADKVHQLEYKFYPKVIERFVLGES